MGIENDRLILKVFPKVNIVLQICRTNFKGSISVNIAPHQMSLIKFQSFDRNKLLDLSKEINLLKAFVMIVWDPVVLDAIAFT